MVLAASLVSCPGAPDQPPHSLAPQQVCTFSFVEGTVKGVQPTLVRAVTAVPEF